MVYDILPTENLEFQDVRDTLAAGGGSVNNDVASAFKTTANINPWSKHKPLILRVDFCQDISPSKPNYNAYWWKGIDNWCGFDPNRLSSYANVPEHVDGGLNGWSYLLPQGGENSPYRIGDFAKYKTNAIPIIGNYSVPELAFANNPSGTFKCSFLLSILQDDYNLSIHDFDLLQSAYLGIYCKKEGTNYSVRATSENTISNGGSMVEIQSFNMLVGEWEVYPFISTIKLIQNEPDNAGGNYYTIPNLEKKTILILSTDLTISISAKIYKSPLRIEYNISVTNLSDSSKQLTNNTLFVKYSNNDIDDPLVTGEKQETLESPIDIPGNFQGEISNGTVYLTDEDMYPSGCKVWVTLNSGYYVKSVSPLIGDFEIPEK